MKKSISIYKSIFFNTYSRHPGYDSICSRLLDANTKLIILLNNPHTEKQSTKKKFIKRIQTIFG